MEFLPSAHFGKGELKIIFLLLNNTNQADPSQFFNHSAYELGAKFIVFQSSACRRPVVPYTSG
jgi:hypothetical protein